MQADTCTSLEQYVVAATGEHHATFIVLHGFTCIEHVRSWKVMLAARLGPEIFGTLRLVFLLSPMRRVSCYKESDEEMRAWHDYFTDHGGDEGRPEVEEEIDVDHMRWCRARIHAVIDEEAEVLGGDASRVALGGQSQGSCVALDAALTYCPANAQGTRLGGCFASFGQVYSSSPVPEANAALPIVAFHGADDRCIAASLALRSYARLLDAGYTHLRLHVEPALGHCVPSKAEGDVLCAALQSWKLVQGPGSTLVHEPLGTPMAAQPSLGGLIVVGAWYGVWPPADGLGCEGSLDVTTTVCALVVHEERTLRLNEDGDEGWYNEQFSDPAHGEEKRMVVHFRFGRHGATMEVVSDGEEGPIIITPRMTAPSAVRVESHWTWAKRLSSCAEVRMAAAGLGVWCAWAIASGARRRMLR